MKYYDKYKNQELFKGLSIKKLELSNTIFTSPPLMKLLIS